MHQNRGAALPAIGRGEQFKVLGAASLGSMLAYFECIICGFMGPQTSRHFSSPDMPERLRPMQTFGISAAGLRPGGGTATSPFGNDDPDRLPRRRKALEHS